MSKPSCDACTRLREYNANFIMNGVTDTVAESLANNTGLNPCLTELHTDCEDLNDVNDCLIGHMDDEVDNYEVCDWKDLLHNFFPNLYETLKAIIAAICGLWTSISSIIDRITKVEDAICAMTVQDVTWIPYDVGTHYYNDDTTWVVDATHRALTFTIGYQALPACGGTKYYFYSMWGSNEQGNNSIKTAIQNESVVAEWTKDDLVPNYITEDMWNNIIAIAKYDSFGGRTLLFQNAYQESLIFYNETTGILSARVWGTIGEDPVGGCVNAIAKSDIPF